MIAYRNSFNDEDCYADLELLPLSKVFFILDCGYVSDTLKEVACEKAIVRLNAVSTNFPDIDKYAIVSTSFPNAVSQLMTGDSASFPIAEHKIYEKVKQNFTKDILYGDYGSINPLRNDNVVMAHGWIPRIDIPLKDRINCFKKRRPKGENSYGPTYIALANKILHEMDFPSFLESTWAVTTIQNCGLGIVSASLNNWIAVRMNMYMHRQIKRLLELNYFTH